MKQRIILLLLSISMILFAASVSVSADDYSSTIDKFMDEIVEVDELRRCDDSIGAQFSRTYGRTSYIYCVQRMGDLQ